MGLRSGWVCVALCLAVAPVRADSTTGEITGTVVDSTSGRGVEGVLVAATSRDTGTTYDTATDADGRYQLTSLPPGRYTVGFLYGDIDVRRDDVPVALGGTSPVHVRIDEGAVGGSRVVITDDPPPIDVGSSKIRFTVVPEYVERMPVPGRTHGGLLGVAPGAGPDLYGTGVGGAQSPESSYSIDGVDTSSLSFGTLGTSLVNEFIAETEIITGGYGAEYGRSTGAIVNVITKSGTNAVRGSAFWYGRTQALIAASRTPPVDGTSIAADTELAYDTDFGVEIGGPIIKDRLWFFAGIAPRLVGVTVERYVQRQTDCRAVTPGGELSACDPALGDGIPDVDPATGFRIYEEIDGTREALRDTRTSVPFVGKLNYAYSASHQGQLAITGTPVTGRTVGIYGEPSATRFRLDQLTTDVSAKWTSKLHDGKTELEAVAGWHRTATSIESIDPAANDLPLERVYGGDLATHGIGGRESPAAVAGCTDSGAAVDPYPLIDNCPDYGAGYALGGPGSLVDDVEERLSLGVTAARRARLAGHHLVKVGADVQRNRAAVPRHLSGGAFYENFLGSHIEVGRYARLAPDGADVCGYPTDELGNPLIDQPITCDLVEGGSPVTGETVNWAAFVQDSWAVQPNLTLNLGVRYEEQRLRYAEELRDQYGENALVMRNMWAPRLGAVYDWTKEGRGKLFANWGRFYESIPMRINERSFGGETFYRQYFAPGQCGAAVDEVGGPSGAGCADVPMYGDQLFGAGTIVAPGVRPQFLDEWVAGAEYELVEDLVVGVVYQDRRLGRVLEDLSTDGANTYIIANPGEWSADEERALEARVEALPEGSPEREALQAQLDMFRGIRSFDPARRVYQGATLSVRKRFSRTLFVQGSYTYARSRGNFPGPFSPDTGQLDPNITSQFDLIELLANRDGPLPNDRPHELKLDGYYVYDLGRAGAVTAGVSLRAVSGEPVDVLGNHGLYGRGETYLLPRGSMGRTPFHALGDVRLTYERPLAGGMTLSVFVDVFNVTNNQGTSSVDEEYTLDPVAPIVGGGYEDLVYLKRTNTAGFETADAASRKLNFANATGRLAPMSGRFGLRLRF